MRKFKTKLNKVIARIVRMRKFKLKMKIKLIGMMQNKLIKMDNKLIKNKLIKTKTEARKFKFKMMAHN